MRSLCEGFPTAVLKKIENHDFFQTALHESSLHVLFRRHQLKKLVRTLKTEYGIGKDQKSFRKIQESRKGGIHFIDIIKKLLKPKTKAKNIKIQYKKKGRHHVYQSE